MRYGELLQRYTDFERLTIPPEDQEKAGCFSSYDRSSTYDETEDRYVCWGANDDGIGYLEKRENGNIVVVEMDGPGVILRTWSALPGKGHIIVWIDHDPTPVIDVPFEDYFDKYGDEIPPMNLTSLVFSISRGRNSLLPIPFQKHIRIEFAPDWGFFYQFTYIQMKKETVLPSLKEMYEQEGQIALAQLDRKLYRRMKHIQQLSGSRLERSILLRPGESVEAFMASEAGIINRFEVIPKGELNGIRIRVYWDGEKEAAVDAELQHFLGQSTSMEGMETIVSGVSRHFCYANWRMPFSVGFRIQFVNESGECRGFETAIVVEKRERQDMESRLRFHAKTHNGWFADKDPKRFSVQGDRWPDWPVLLTKGKGRFCGMHLHVQNDWENPATAANQWFNGKWDKKNIDWWWGEGDEKFFVDGEKFPSTFGTGSEDYFGYAWAAEPPFPVFDSPYVAMDMPIDGNGCTSAVRYHVADDIPFRTGFEAYIEKYKEERWKDNAQCKYMATAFWYLEAHREDGYPLMSAATD